MSSLTTSHAPKGLEGVVATNSKICFIDGDRGVLAYRGIDIHELADHSNFEETCYLLWFGKLPTRTELRELHERLAEERKLDASIITLVRNAPRHALPMDVLRTAVSALSFYDPQEKSNDRKANVDKAIRLTSQIAMIVAAYDRIRKGKPIVEPDRSLSHAANFLLMLNGKHPTATAERALDIALILHADHELNASSGADVIDYVKGMLAQKKKIPGFGHRVYHTEDPRATHLRVMSRDLGNSSGQAKWFDISQKIEEFVKADKKLNANVDFYSASTYHTLGIDVDLFTPIFAVSRVSGWAAHVIEQLDDNRLIRPRAEYLGPEYPNHYVAIDQR